MSVLAITGITSKSGSYFYKLLIQNKNILTKKYSGGIRFLVRESSDLSLMKNSDFHYEIYRDKLGLANYHYVCNALKDVDTVVHIAGIFYSENIVDAAIACHVRRLILVHTTGIYSKYKKAGEEYRRIDKLVYEKCKANRIIITILRPTMIYGNMNDHNISVFIKLVDKLPIMPVVNNAQYVLQPVHCDDLGEAYYQVLLNESSTANLDFDLSGGAPILLRDILSEIAVCLNKQIRFFNVPFIFAYLLAWLLFLVTFSKYDYREKVQRLCEPRAYSHASATLAFGYQPRTFQEGIASEVREYLSNKENRKR